MKTTLKAIAFLLHYKDFSTLSFVGVWGSYKTRTYPKGSVEDVTNRDKEIILDLITVNGALQLTGSLCAEPTVERSEGHTTASNSSSCQKLA